MKKTFINTTFIIFAFALLLFSPFYVEITLAQPTPTPAPTATPDGTYNLLAPIPCVGGDCSGQLATETTLPQYVKGFIQLSIGISAVFAIVMIVIGGFQYMTSDALQGKQDGKTRIKNSAIGILLIAASFIILQTINPDLLDIKLKIDASPTAQSGTQTGQLSAGSIAGRRMTDAEIAESNALRDRLEELPGGGIFTNAGPCERGQTTGCTNLNGLPQSAIDGLIELRRVCAGCSITITGGTEAGHKTHGVGMARIDLRDTDQALNTYIITNGGTPRQTSLGPEYTVIIGGKSVTFLRESNPRHWHVSF